MPSKIIGWFKSLRISREIKRSLPFFLLPLILLVPDSSVITILNCSAVVFLVLVTAHWSRKLLFPYVDLETLFISAQSDPKASAVVFLSMTGFMMMVIGVSIMLLK